VRVPPHGCRRRGAQCMRALRNAIESNPPHACTHTRTNEPQVVRAICILDHPLPKTKPADAKNKYGGAMSAQIIIPANQVSRKTVSCL
jgi:hypothetical protein